MASGAGAGAAAAEADFSQLPSDLLSLIGGKLDLAVDRVCFGSICKSWRSSLNPPFPHPPWLFLSDFQDQIQTIDNCLKEIEDEESLSESETEEEIHQIETEEEKGVVNLSIPPCSRPRSFVGVGDQQIYELDLPEAYQTRCVGSTGNWLITIDLLGMICLLNPFSRVQLYLPPHSTFQWENEEGEGWDATPNLRRDASLWKTILSSSTPNKKDCIAIAIYGGVKNLAIARPGDSSWIDIDCPTTRSFDDIVIYKEQLYGVNTQGTVVVCDNITSAFDDDRLHSPPKASILMDRFQIPNIGSLTIKKYLVEWLGELLLVIKFVKDEEYVPIPSYNTTSFKIYKLDFANKKWDEVNSLGDYSLFLGFNTSISILASNYSTWVKKNCIYFTDDYTYGYRGSGIKGGHDMGVFDVETNSIQPHYEGISLSFYSPPIWIVPTAPSKVPINLEMQGENATLHYN